MARPVVPPPSGLRRARVAAVLLGIAVAAMTPAPAGATDDPAPATNLVSAAENTKAALVRIEVSATAEIAHIDHSTGDVNVMRGRYEVPIRSATGVFTSSDGTIATTGAALQVAEDQVVVHAANLLFQEQMGTALVGNDGDPSRPAQAVDPYWAPHLQHCYQRVEHCVLFFVPHFTVFPYTRTGTSTPAELLPVPGGPGDVGLLRISGGGGTPTAELAPSEQAAPEQAVVTGFAGRPSDEGVPSEVAVTVDDGTGELSSDADVTVTMSAGMTGAPMLDPDTGEVVGLATTLDGQPTLVPVEQVHSAIGAAEVSTTRSEFDTVFRRGVDHLSSGQASASAESALREALTYYDSALAARHLSQAEETAGAREVSDPSVPGDDGGLPGGPALWVGGGVIAALVLGGAYLLRRRRDGKGRPRTAGGSPADAPAVQLPETAPSARPDTEDLPASPLAAPPPAAPRAGTPARAPQGGEPAPPAERTRLRQSPALLEDSVRTARLSPAFCSSCGNSLRDGARFCASCGSPVH